MTPTCDGGTATVTGLAGGTFAFNPVPTDGVTIDTVTGEVTNGINGTTYTIEYTTSGACPATTSQDLTVLDLDDPSFTMTPTCDGGTATVTGLAGGTFAFNPVPTDGAVVDTATGEVTGGVANTTYTIEYTTSGACPQSSTQGFTILTADDPNFTMTPTCDGGTATVTGLAGGTFAFNPVPTDGAVIDTASGEVTGGTSNTTYTVEYTTAGACPQSSTQNVTVSTADDASFTMTPTCDGGTATVTGLAGGTFAFNPVPTDGATIDTVTGEVTNGTNGTTYTIEYTTSGACPATTSQDLTVLEASVLSTTLDTTVCADEVSGVVLDVEPGSIAAVTYDITAINQNGLVASAGAPAVGTGFGANEISDDAYTNTTAAPVIVTYTIVPVSADGCAGNPFDVNITISPEPILSTTLDATVCSGDASGVLLDVEPGSVAATTYDITVINTNGLVASAGAPAVGTGFGANEISDDAYTNTTSAPVVVSYTIVPVSAQGCSGNPFDVNITVDSEPTPNYTNPTTGDPHEIRVCDDDPTQLMVELFDLTQLEGDIIPLGSGYNVVYFRTEQDAIDRVNGIPDPMNYPNIDPVETIYVRVENAFDCFVIVEIEIEVYALPDASVDVTDWLVCENNTDFLFDFDLDSKIPEILGPGQSEVDFEVTFYSTQLAADTLDPTFLLTSPHENLGNPQLIFVVITNRTTGCRVSTQSFNIEVQDGADANDDFYEECDVTNENDGSTQFDLESRIPIILGPGQTLADFSVDFYADFNDAFAGNTNILPLLYENITNPHVIYARVSNRLSPEECFDIAEVTLQVNLLPIFDLDDEYILCLTSNEEAVVDIPPIMDTGLPGAEYTFQWSLDDTDLAGENQPSLDPTPYGAGIYAVLVTNATTGCFTSDTAEVIESGIPDTFDVEVTSMAFTGNNMIVATATGNSTYEYSLDQGPFQLIGEFQNVTGGEHVVYVRDVNGCGILSQVITIIDYQRFFTPNGDGQNDTWQIKGIDSQADAVIYIHDRYGKLIKQLSPTGPGWDGTYNGNRMPSSDYWFVLEYREPNTNERKTFRAHFALKR